MSKFEKGDLVYHPGFDELAIITTGKILKQGNCNRINGEIEDKSSCDFIIKNLTLISKGEFKPETP